MKAKELRKAVRQLPPIEDFDHKWQRHRESMRNHILNEDMRGFLQWSTIQATMYNGMSKFVGNRFNDLCTARYRGRYRKLLTTPATGSPHYFDKKRKIGANYIHQTHHLMRLERTLWLDVNNLSTIAEFGGGYGALCNIVRNAGFEGNYHIYDFPEMLLLQRYYLERLKKHANYHQEFYSREVDLLIAICSLSEAPIAVRQEFLAKVKARFYYIRFQKVFFDIDNMRWFTRWASRNLDEDKWSIYRTRRRAHFILAGVGR